MKDKLPHIHRDISWLSFNYRVLQEVSDPNVPLKDKIKFIAIYSSNLGEFFRVRVASHKNLLRLSKKTKKELDEKPGEILKQILKIVNQQQIEFSEIFRHTVLAEMAANKVFFVRRKELTADQELFVQSFFEDNLLPYVQPMLLKGDLVKPFLINTALYLSLVMESAKDKKRHFALVQIPSQIINRFVELPPSKPGRKEIMLLDDIVRYSVRHIFPGFDVKDTFSLKITRDAELYIDDEFTGDLMEKLKKSLRKRDVGPTSRMVYDRKMPKDLLSFLINSLGLHDTDLLPEGRYHNNFDFFKFPDFAEKSETKEMPLLPLAPLEKAKDIFNVLKKQDHFIHVPYHNYESVVKFFEQAADDPRVSHIRIVHYRVARSSRIMAALIKAAKAGKQVTTFIEIKARFDEENNLEWGEKLTQAGVRVLYSMPGVKVHSKIALVSRVEKGINHRYAFLSTGNFHEGTARVYSDMGIFTYDTRITEEVHRIFKFLETKERPAAVFKHLGVGNFNLKQKLIELVKREIKHAKNGKKARLTLKMNSLQDPEMINLLYRAGNEGVKIDLIIRGICCIVPQVKGISENINAIGMIDRYLEHARVFIFDNNGAKDIYLSSADWMTRNLHHRVETMFPIYDEKIKKIILDVIDLQLKDNVKARSLNFNNVNEYIKNDKNPVRSQEATYDYLKKLTK